MWSACSLGGTAFGAVISIKVGIKDNSSNTSTNDRLSLRPSTKPKSVAYHSHPDLPESMRLPTLLFHPVISQFKALPNNHR
jgi:hypothetical protein